MSKEKSLEEQLVLLAENVNLDIYNQRKWLLGRVLTVLDATTTDPQQRKATKDLIDGIFYESSYWNGIKWQFQQMAKANGFKILEDHPLQEPTEPLNIYK